MINIDVTNFDDALAEDRDGSFHSAVEGHLTQALADHQALIQRGLSPTDFDEAKKIEAAYAKAIDVIRFSSSLKRSK